MFILYFECVFRTLLLFICKCIDFESGLCKMLKTKKCTRSATTNFGKEEVLKSAHASCSDLNIIQGGREAHILYSAWARGVDPRYCIPLGPGAWIPGA